MKSATLLVGLLCALGLAACAGVKPAGEIVPAEEVGQVAGTYVGAKVDALAANEAGPYLDQLGKVLSAQLALAPAFLQPQVRKSGTGTLLISVSVAASFEPNSGELRPEALDAYSVIASVLRQYDKSVIHVIGYASNSQDDAAAQDLSARQAASVAAYLEAQDVARSRLRYESRASLTGQPQGTTLDLVIVPVIQGQEAQAWMPPLVQGG